MIGLNLVYTVVGVVFAIFALSGLRDRRWANGAFHGLIALSFLAGDRLGDIGNGVLVLVLVAIAASGRMRRSEPVAPPQDRHGAKVFLPALIVPAVALLGTLAFKQVPALVDPKQATLVALTLGTIIALILCRALLQARVAEPFVAGRGLIDDIGWVAVMPQLLASLGAVFALAGVGQVVGTLIGTIIPAGSVIGAVLAYALGMALFTIVMGNAFAAFPVMAAAVGVPLLIQRAGGDPAIVAAVGMLAGFCGTLLTPMAANFNLLPAALLGLKDKYGVIRAQAPTALLLLVFNILLLYGMIA
ncbi:hypothetical protein SUS17_2728 [Sphingomonas sp. S17]|uniref:DUF979 domain-containing protein n=2 Tax=Sphingomonas paucimobilis TaxID=13689 RepID=A0A411LHR5_SPHPI|nr:MULTISPECIES: DUF979 domain-containing protein [Sphingomonas]EGI54396.1 hypothetical protein SUS17_2728 [Sphingomonas sp. S17]MBQ1479374.1 DUF979 domain-containing protein [Sphingomonas sp.]MCM3677945.1 DUF979 domain-containing protein [Sphingomonas paucimobilis]MDG5972574.1 hypothetical protein [Sphingomonas paucimobilis]NNG59004.1 DUF979 domain-containing protein [Sphingomonas paucimobilis]